MKVAVSGGGTGGHIYPALALIKEMKKMNPEAEFLYIGTANGLEKNIVERENIPFKSIEITGFKRKISLDNVKTVMRFLKGVKTSKHYLKEFKPDAVIGTGGYVCGPVVYAAAKLGIPTVIHEQNSLPGLTNKFLSRYTDKVAICFEEARKYFPADKAVMTGNPRASEVAGVNGEKGKLSAGLKPGVKSVLVFGGSRGARPINKAILEVLPQLGEKDYQLLYVTGEVHYKQVAEEAKATGSPSNVIIKPFIHNMPEVLAGTDLIVGRAGATSIAEITALGLPSILIPSPYVTANHQEVNARSLSDKGAAVLMLEKDLNGPALLKEIDRIMTDEAELMKMRNASAKIGMPDAAARLAEVLGEVSTKK
ncbi:undecaprenyldiphospho-muramoylpentapeptide beta-N-acetylglucosaminyltransferase [Bacillus mangrovi]|uniref:UDP-N-acetylglucosamine--N-acetylmuramyl-(pentapeptide) pyrophosphoryl-undecaprenol N-acetylglucosamine transferase n=1 Tax=Metabacillus mangrovi TaxID=1491830 RepID=A0A7X2S2T0_9BACI|nr:undecaprenyldiphospho-muramoylpentapeptide beta-N-acetylglucosaminyltransferase [Metabacillus mangrovi]MTH52638.1 undecaprenyldiphospho-muramoylpentapeptide beta-N-acetylglucosaminyltransferase [Metabacillus mangrovi]